MLFDYWPKIICGLLLLYNALILGNFINVYCCILYQHWWTSSKHQPSAVEAAAATAATTTTTTTTTTMDKVNHIGRQQQWILNVNAISLIVCSYVHLPSHHHLKCVWTSQSSWLLILMREREREKWLFHEHKKYI